MKNDLAQIVVVLDRSGSMGRVRGATIDSFNEFINGQKIVSGDANVLLVQFDSEGPHDIVFDKPLGEIPKLTEETYIPRGGTPLHDAMGWTINEVGKRLSSVSEQDRPGKVIFAVITDGAENASKEFSQDSVAALVKQQREKYQWTFIFLGANQDAVLTAKGFGIAANTAATYYATRDSIMAASSYLSRATASARSGRTVDITEIERARMAKK